MVKQALALALAGLYAGSSMAAVTIQTVAFGGLASPAGAVVVDFEGANLSSILPSGFTGTTTGNVGLFTGSQSGVAAAPMGDASQYLAIGNGSYTLTSATGYSNLSFYWGSIDAGNTLDLLDSSGNSFFTVTGSNALLSSDADGNWFSGADNRTVLINSDQKIFGARFSYTKAAFEIDNVVFDALSATPEPATWAMMAGGFGLIGFALRNSRRTIRASIA